MSINSGSFESFNQYKAKLLDYTTASLLFYLKNEFPWIKNRATTFEGRFKTRKILSGHVSAFSGLDTKTCF